MLLCRLCSKKTLDSFCVAVRNGHRAGKPYVVVKYSGFIMELLRFFFKEGFISSFQIISSIDVRVYLVYRDGVGLLGNLFGGLRIKPFGARSYSFRHLVFSDIVNLYNKGVFGIVRTSKGFLTYEEIVRGRKACKIGGFSIVQIFF